MATKRKHVIHLNYGSKIGDMRLDAGHFAYNVKILLHLVRTPSGVGKVFTSNELNAYIKRIGSNNCRYAH